MNIEFFIPGKPEALKRHRTFRRGAININVDPSAVAKDSFLLQAMQHKPKEPITEAFALIATFHFQRPKAHFNSKGLVKESAPKMHTSKPDIDNLTKFIADALNQVFWRDDSLICRLWAEKVYSDIPGVSVKIIPADAEYFGIKSKENHGYVDY